MEGHKIRECIDQQKLSPMNLEESWINKKLIQHCISPITTKIFCNIDVNAQVI